MSGEEKAAQIGNAVSEYQTAKVELAHIEKRIETVFSTYLKAGASMDRSRGTPSPPRFKDEQLIIGWYGGDVHLNNLLNAEELAKIVRERDEAQARFIRAKKSMEALGITSVD
jgi:hypothetical protein